MIEKDYRILNLIPLLRKIERRYNTQGLKREGILFNTFRTMVLADITQQLREGIRFKNIIIDRPMELEDQKAESLLAPLISDEEKEELRKIDSGEIQVVI